MLGFSLFEVCPNEYCLNNHAVLLLQNQHFLCARVESLYSVEITSSVRVAVARHISAQTLVPAGLVSASLLDARVFQRVHAVPRPVTNSRLANFAAISAGTVVTCSVSGDNRSEYKKHSEMKFKC